MTSTDPTRNPHVGHDGVPVCSGTNCPKYSKYNGRCSETGVDGPTFGSGVCSPAVRDMVLELDARKDAADPAFDEIVQLCGLAKTWEYPGQVIRDVRDALKKRDDKIAALRACVVYARDRRSSAFDFDTWIDMVDKALEGTLPAHAVENAQANEAKAWEAMTTMRNNRDDLKRQLAILNDERTADLNVLSRQGLVIEELRTNLRAALAVRDDARRASQRYLDEKREVEERLRKAVIDWRLEVDKVEAEKRAIEAAGAELTALVSKFIPPGERQTDVDPRPGPALARAVMGETEHDQYDLATGELGAPLLTERPRPARPSSLDVPCRDHDAAPGEYCKPWDTCNARRIAAREALPRFEEQHAYDTIVLPKKCACSDKYRELAPGTHAKYCPLAGHILDDGRPRWRCSSCNITYANIVDKCLQCGGFTSQVPRG